MFLFEDYAYIEPGHLAYSKVDSSEARKTKIAGMFMRPDSRPDSMQAKVIDDKVAAKERKKDFEINWISRFRYRTRYFTDSGIFGSK